MTRGGHLRRRCRLRLLAATLPALLLATLLPAALLPSAQAAGTTRELPRSLTLSAKGAAFLATFEGFVARPYDDPGGNCTIGYGHLIHRGACTTGDRSTWGTISRRRGLRLLHSDADLAVQGLRSRLARTRLHQYEFDALVSFVYNIGLGNFDTSSVERDLQASPPQYAAVPRDLRKWVYSNHVFLCGLYRRRVNEGHLFRTGSYAMSTPPCPSSAQAGRAADGAVSAAPGGAR